MLFADTSELGYKYVRTAKGHCLLVIQGYTFTKHTRSTNFYCSKKNSGCRAKVKLDFHGHITRSYIVHNHSPPTYFETFTGSYFHLSAP